jgi:hypothetical protein
LSQYDQHKYELAQHPTFLVKFQCEANWERFADERNDPELAQVIADAVRAEFARRAGAVPDAQEAEQVSFVEPASTQPKDTKTNG